MSTDPPTSSKSPTSSSQQSPIPPVATQAIGKSETWRALAAYKQMLVLLFVATLVVIIAMIVVLKLSTSILIFAAILTGALGAFFSALSRLYNFEGLPKVLTLEELQALPQLHLIVYSLAPAVVGAISAMVLYAIFAAELIKGDLFPAFSCDGPGKCDTFASLFDIWNPDQAKDYAKVLVWSFIAGFAERLVPNALQNFSKTMPAMQNVEQNKGTAKVASKSPD
jgi:hypothetical protein